MLSTTNPFVELCGGRRWIDIQFRAQGFHTGLVLPQREMMLFLATVALHQAAMRVFATDVTRQNLLAGCLTGCVLLQAEIDLAEAVERIQIGHAQTLTG